MTESQRLTPKQLRSMDIFRRNAIYLLCVFMTLHVIIAGYQFFVNMQLFWVGIGIAALALVSIIIIAIPMARGDSNGANEKTRS